MHTSRFQILLNSMLAAGLGAAGMAILTTPQAIGYPAGAAVSLGTNPVASFTGHLSTPDSHAVTDAPTESALVITDIIVTLTDTSSSCRSNVTVLLEAGSTAIGRFNIGASNSSSNYTNYDPSLVASLTSGLIVPPGETLTATTQLNYEGSCSSSRPEVDYTFSGYYAQP